MIKENLSVRKKRGRPRGDANKLTRDFIVIAAREWMLQEHKSLSIRALANHLNIDPMAIYYYFDNKAALLEAITVSIMQEIYMPKSNESWQIELKKLSQSYLRQLQDHPGLLETLLSMGGAVQAPAEVFRERFNLAIAPLELDDNLKKAALDLLIDYLHGVAFAAHCAKDQSTADVYQMDEPFALYLRSLEHGS